MSRTGEAGAFEAALNLLREQLRAVADVRRQISSDETLRAEDPKHQHALMVQTLNEMGQLGRAISTLEAVDAGRIVVAPEIVLRPSVAAADLPPIERSSGLMGKIPPPSPPAVAPIGWRR
nr:hypothetical protein [uncultured Brevundimonas sp.]